MQEVKQILKDNVNVNKPTKNNVNVNNVRRIATRLVDKLNDPDSHKFFCQVAWSLTEHQIESNLEQALKGRNPKAYFTFLCKLQLKVV